MNIVPAVVCLFFCGCPSAISWFVIAVVVNAVNRVVFAWSLSHVPVKRLKRVPFFADRNATTPVAGVCRIRAAVASTEHCSPRIVFWRAILSVAGNYLTMAAPAALSAAFSDNCNVVGSAVTKAQPCSCAKLIETGVFLNGKPPETLSGQVVYTGRDDDRIDCSHDDTPDIRVVRMAEQFTLSGYSYLYTEFAAT